MWYMWYILLFTLSVLLITWKFLFIGGLSIKEKWSEVPHLENKDMVMFKRYLEKGTRCFEFGCGWGTIWIAKLPNIERLKSIENDIVWYEKITKRIEEEKLENIAEICYVDTDSNHSGWGFPKSKNLEKWRNYYASYSPSFNADIILIDGRFRVSCGLDLVRKIETITFVMIDDFLNREHYHVLLKYYDKVECGKIAVILKKKLLINEEELDADIKKYQLDNR